jgi:hypothetical protein
MLQKQVTSSAKYRGAFGVGTCRPRLLRLFGAHCRSANIFRVGTAEPAELCTSRRLDNAVVTAAA